MQFLEKLEFSKTFLNTVFFSLITTSSASFSKIESYLGELGPQPPLPPPPKMAQFIDALLSQKLLKIYNFTTTNAMKMKFPTIVYLHETFHLKKDLGMTHGVWEGVVKKPLKNPPKKSVFLG